MATIKEIREKYPQYNKLSDQELADRLHDAHYSHMPKEEFYKKIGHESANPLTKIFKHTADLPLGLNFLGGLASNFVPDKMKGLVGNPTQIMTGQEPGVAQELAKGLGQYAPAAMSVGGAPGLIGNIARVDAAGGLGALQHPENRGNGIYQGIISGIGGEALPLGARLLKGYAEQINPIAFAKSMGDKMGNLYQNYKKGASATYNSLRDKYKDSPLYTMGEKIPSFNMLKLPDEAKQYFDVGIKRLYNKLIEEPTYENLHKFQSQVGSKIGKLLEGSQDQATYDAIQSLKDTRSAAHDDLNDFLKRQDPKDYARYENARGITRDVIKPFEENSSIKNLVQGRVEKVDPQDLFGTINKMSENGEIPEGHFLNQFKEALGDRMKTASGINTGASLGAGTMLGSGLFGLPGGIAGSALGYGAKMAMPYVAKAIQEPLFEQLGQRLTPTYNALKGSLVGYTASK